MGKNWIVCPVGFPGNSSLVWMTASSGWCLPCSSVSCFSYTLIDLEAWSDSGFCLFVLARLLHRWWCLLPAGGTSFLMFLFLACWLSLIIMPRPLHSLGVINGVTPLPLLHRRLPCRETSPINSLFTTIYSSFREDRINAWFLPFTRFQIMYCFLIIDSNKSIFNTF